MAVGGIYPRKNHLSLCYAVDLLRQNGSKVELTIVGKGYQDNSKYLKKLEHYIKDKSYITLLKNQNQEELLNTYRAHDIFVLPSRTETFGLVYVEALTQGLPIIYTKGQGISGCFESGEVGYAVHSKNITEIAQAISLAISHYSLLTTHIKHLDFSIFDWEQIAERYLKIYQECNS